MRLRAKLFIGFGTVFIVLLLLVGAFLCLLLHRTSGSYFDSAGIRIFYTVEGTGTPLILVHGLAANADLNWRRPGVTRTLAQDFQVISFDLRGHGLSDKPDEPDKYGVQMVDDIIPHGPLKFPCTCGGYSLGGFLALKAVTMHPDRSLALRYARQAGRIPGPLPAQSVQASENEDTGRFSQLPFSPLPRNHI